MTTLQRLMPYDQKGVLGPSLSLLSMCQTYTSKELILVIKILQENAESVAKTSIQGRKKFIGMVKTARQEGREISVQQVLQSKLFRGLQVKEPLPPTHDKVVSLVAPNILKQTPTYLPAIRDILSDNENTQNLTLWMAMVLSNYMTQGQIENECKFQELIKLKPEIMQARIDAGRPIYGAAQRGELSKTAFYKVIDCLKNCLDTGIDLQKFAEPSEETLASFGELEGNNTPQALCAHIHRYLTCFSMAGEDSSWLGPYICDMLVKIFKEKFFPDSSGLIPMDPRGGMGAILCLLYRSNTYSSDELKTVAKAAKRNYIFLSGQEVHGRKAFCQMFEKAKEEGRTVSIDEILSSQMMQEMRPKELDSASHELAAKHLAPTILTMAKRFMPELCEAEFSEEVIAGVTERLAFILESYMSKEDIQNECRVNEFMAARPEMIKLRGNHGMKIYRAAESQKLTEPAFNTFITILTEALNQEDPASSLLKLTNDEQIEGLPDDATAPVIEEHVRAYAGLFALAGDDAAWVGKHIMRMHSHHFRPIFFPGSE